MKYKTRSGILVSPCILSPGLQAERKPGDHWGYQFVELLIQHEIDIFPLPCPESSFGGYLNGLQREKHGINYYMSLEGYEKHCRQLAEQSADYIADCVAGGYRFICILGVEHSPTCAVNYMYSCQGMLKRAGVFFDILQMELKQRDLEIPQIGINRLYTHKGYISLEQMIKCFEES